METTLKSENNQILPFDSSGDVAQCDSYERFCLLKIQVNCYLETGCSTLGK